MRNSHNNISKYAQYYKINLNSENSDNAVGRPLVHKSAVQQTTGKFLLIFKIINRLN